MKMKPSLFLLAACMVIVALFAGSCDTTSEQKRSVVTVFSMNDNEPVFSDVLGQSDTVSTVSDDWIPVWFFNKPQSDLVFTEPGRPFGEFIVTGYTVTWERTDGGSAVPQGFSSAIQVTVPSGELMEATVLVVPAEAKNAAPLDALKNTASSIRAVAHFQFVGHEVGTEREVTIPASVSVSFADFAES